MASSPFGIYTRTWRSNVADLFDQRIGGAELLRGDDAKAAIRTICRNHYARSVSSGKTYYCRVDAAIVAWSIPANKNIGRFLLGREAEVWELSRLWAPDGHERNLLSRAISAAVKLIVAIERPEVLVSYADPSAGHSGGVYRAASWIQHGTCEESRGYRDSAGRIVARRAFHSGDRSLTKAEIESLGYTQVSVPGKIRFVKPVTRRAAKELRPWEK